MKSHLEHVAYKFGREILGRKLSDDEAQACLIGVWRAEKTHDKSKSTFRHWANYFILQELRTLRFQKRYLSYSGGLKKGEKAPKFGKLSMDYAAGDFSYHDILSEEWARSPDTVIDDQRLAKRLLKVLPKREKRVIQRWMRGHTNKDMAEQDGVCHAMITRVFQRAIVRMRNAAA